MKKVVLMAFVGLIVRVVGSAADEAQAATRRASCRRSACNRWWCYDCSGIEKIGFDAALRHAEPCKGVSYVGLLAFSG